MTDFDANAVLEQLEPLLVGWLPGQRWFSSADETPSWAKFTEHEVLREANPKLIWTLIETDHGAIYQAPIGLRETEHIGGVLLGHNKADIGRLAIDGVEYIAYDALIDPILGRVLFDSISDGSETVRTVRPIGAEQSNTSLVYDNRLILKVFRRLYAGANPDLEVTKQLTDVGFKHVARVVMTWERGDLDLAVCQPYLFDGTDGWALALASVRDFFGADTQGATSTAGSPSVRINTADPGAAGGDFADEAFRLGEMTAGLHLALGENFSYESFDPAGLVESLSASINTLAEPQRPALQRLIDSVSALDASDCGRAMRIHGDFHLGQTLRSVSGWYVFDFEGEPARPLEERVRPSSPLKDVAGMLRSFHYAAATGLFEAMPTMRDSLQGMAAAWEQRNRNAFQRGFMSVDGVEKLLPQDDAVTTLLLSAFEVEKAIYELAYERAYRPDWMPIPQVALTRLLG